MRGGEGGELNAEWGGGGVGGRWNKTCRRMEDPKVVSYSPVCSQGPLIFSNFRFVFRPLHSSTRPGN